MHEKSKICKDPDFSVSSYEPALGPVIMFHILRLDSATTVDNGGVSYLYVEESNGNSAMNTLMEVVCAARCLMLIWMVEWLAQERAWPASRSQRCQHTTRRRSRPSHPSPTGASRTTRGALARTFPPAVSRLHHTCSG